MSISPRLSGAQATPPVDTASIAVLTVTYHPDLARLARQMHALPPDARLVLVDNGSSAAQVEALRHLAEGRPNTRLLLNESNVGLAAALNQAAAEARDTSPACGFLLLMDQDTEPRGGAVASLLHWMRVLEAEGQPVGCVGPLLIDHDTRLRHGFHCLARWRWTRVYPAAGDPKPVECASLNGSGTLVRAALFERLGGLDESMFIDHVDTEWSFRVMASGFRLYGIQAAVFDHGMGERGLRFWCFGWRVWPYRSPQRHYYLFRNATRLMRLDYVPGAWKVWAVAKLSLTAVAHLVFDHQRVRQVGAMLRGAWAGCGEHRPGSMQ